MKKINQLRYAFFIYFLLGIATAIVIGINSDGIKIIPTLLIFIFLVVFALCLEYLPHHFIEEKKKKRRKK